MVTKIRALLMLSCPAGWEGVGVGDRHRRALDELLSADSHWEVCAEFVTPARLALARFDPADVPESEALEQVERPDASYDYVEVSAELDVNLGAIISRYPSFESAPELTVNLAAVNAVGRAIDDLVLAANLAKLGSVEVAGGIYVIDGPFDGHTVGTRMSMLSVVVEEAATLGWPPIRELTVGEVWRWMRQLPGFDEGTPRGRGGRALAAFSYQLKGSTAENSPIDLVWALVGLEALYGKGKEGLRAQLIEKSQALLGKPQAFRKRFHGMYDYRSRFVHGDLDLPLSYELYTGSKATSTFANESDTTLTTAVAVLVASLQELVVRGWAEPHFSYVVDGAP